MLPKPTNNAQIEQPGQQPIQSDQSSNVMDDRLKRKRGTGFTNISRILGANVGAGQRMGSKIGESLQSKAGEIRKGIEQGQSKFAAGKAEGSKEAQEAIQKSGELARKSFEQQEEFAGLSAPELAEQGKRLREAEYKGPQALEEAGKLQSKAATGAALSRLGGTSSGQSQLLASQVAQRGGYGRGMSEFDKMLLGREGQKQIQTGRGALAGIETEAERAITGAESEAIAKQRGIEQERVGQIQDIRNRLYGTGTKEFGGITGIKTQAEQQANKFAEDANRVKQLIMGMDERGAIGTPENPLKPRDEELISKIDQYKLGLPEKIYADDPALLQRTLSSISGLITPDEGGYLFRDKQQQAASNLAAMLGGLQDAQGISQLKNVQTEFKPKDTTYQEQKDVAKEQEDLEYGLSMKDNPNALKQARFGVTAERFLGADTVQKVKDKVYDEETGFMSSSTPTYINNRIRNILEDLMRKKLRSQTNLVDLIKQRSGIGKK